jgi:DNA-binding transcriptional LysR family regulator
VAAGGGSPTPYERMRASIYDRMMSACHAGGLSPHIVAEANTSEARLSLVAAGMGLSFVDELQAGRAPPEIVLKRLADFSVPLSLSLVWRSQNRSPTLERFLDLVRRQSEALLAEGRLCADLSVEGRPDDTVLPRRSSSPRGRSRRSAAGENEARRV